MFLNNRKAPKELLYWNALDLRSNLSSNERYILRTLQKGYEGECLYDKIFDEIGHENTYILRDIYLSAGKAAAQYDSIIISGNRVVVNEVKNISGDYRFENNNWYKNGRELSDNAFAQLSRAKGRLKKLRNECRLNFEVEGNLIFPNDDFRLTTENQYVLKETVLRNHMRKYFRQFKDERLSANAMNIAEIIQENAVENPYFNESADIFKIRRGLYCGQCKTFDLYKGRFQMSCNRCGSVESNETHLLRAMGDFEILFSGVPMTRSALLYFIDFQISRTAVYKVLKKHCDITGQGRNTAYKLKYAEVAEVIAKIRETQRYKDRITQI